MADERLLATKKMGFRRRSAASLRGLLVSVADATMRLKGTRRDVDDADNGAPLSLLPVALLVLGHHGKQDRGRPLAAPVLGPQSFVTP